MPFAPGQVSEMLKLPESTIRLYAKLFAEHLSPQPRKHRLYTEHDILTLARIKELRSKHIPQDEISNLLRVEPIGPEAEESVLSLVPSLAGEIESASKQSRIALARVEELTAQLVKIAGAQGRQAAQLAALQYWAALPWWKRLFTRPPSK